MSEIAKKNEVAQKAAPKSLGMMICDMGRSQFSEMIAIENPRNAQQALARWEIGLRQRVFRTENIEKCDRGQVLAAFLEACQWGFDPSPARGHFYLVPYAKDCQMIPSKEGLMHAAMRTGKVDRIMYGVLYKHEALELQKSGTPLFSEEAGRPNVQPMLIDSDEDRSDAAIVGAWVACKLKGEKEWRNRYMLRSQIEKRRATSKNPNGLKWTKWYPEACIVTVTKAFFKSALNSDLVKDEDTRLNVSEQFVQADASVVSTRSYAEPMQIEHDVADDDPFPGNLEDLLEELAKIEEQLEIDPNAVAEHSTRHYGEIPDALTPVLVSRLIRDIREGKVTS